MFKLVACQQKKAKNGWVWKWIYCFEQFYSKKFYFTPSLCLGINNFRHGYELSFEWISVLQNLSIKILLPTNFLFCNHKFDLLSDRVAYIYFKITNFLCLFPANDMIPHVKEPFLTKIIARLINFCWLPWFYLEKILAVEYFGKWQFMINTCALLASNEFLDWFNTRQFNLFGKTAAAIIYNVLVTVLNLLFSLFPFYCVPR